MQMITEQQDLKPFQNTSVLVNSPEIDIEFEELIQQFHDKQHKQSESLKQKLKRLKRRLMREGLEKVPRHQKIEEQDFFHQKQNKFTLDDQSNNIYETQGMEMGEPEVSEDELFSGQKCKMETKNTHNPVQEQDKVSYREGSIEQPAQSQLSFNQSLRRQKVKRYLYKKNNRIQCKMVAYQCRKVVAEARLRWKGRFVTKERAEEMLQIDLSRMCNRQIKTLLEKKQKN